jgi:choline dehydrogenase-like flavoprotein
MTTNTRRLFLCLFILAPLTFTEGKKYDYIILGCGTGGSVAFELANTGKEVLCIDRGNDRNFFDENGQRVQESGNLLSLNSPLNVPFRVGVSPVKEYFTSSQSRRAATAGFVVGGGSSISGAADIWPHESHYDYFYITRGGLPANWSFSAIKKCHKAVENFTSPYDGVIPSPDRGSGGHIHVIKPDPDHDDVTTLTLEAFNSQFNVTYTDDLSLDSFNHSGILQRNLIPQTLANIAFPNRSNYYVERSRGLLNSLPNLQVRYNSTITKLLMDGGKAIGVAYLGEESCGEVFLSKDGKIILASGALISPQILLLSGVGDCSYLEAFGVECNINNSAVGKNFVDNVGYYTGAVILSPNTSRPDGPVVFMNLRSPYETRPIADMLVSWTTEAGFFLMVNVVAQPTTGLQTSFIGLKSTNPLDTPFVSWDFQPRPGDTDAQKILWAQSNALKALNLTGLYGPTFQISTTLPLPTLNVNTIGNAALPYFHYGGSLALGKAVDASGKVVGSENIYVIDGSILPTAGYANPSREIYANAMNILNNLEPSLNLCL